jgi:hypothetical protein
MKEQDVRETEANVSTGSTGDKLRLVVSEETVREVEIDDRDDDDDGEPYATHPNG